LYLVKVKVKRFSRSLAETSRSLILFLQAAARRETEKKEKREERRALDPLCISPKA
jgi:hypothetical protein